MKFAIEGNSTVIVYEESDYAHEIEPSPRDREKLDKGGELVLCSENGECWSSSRIPKDYKISK